MRWRREESRRQRGEGAWTQVYDQVRRLKLLQGIVEKLKPAEQRRKEREKACLAKEKKEKAAGAKAVAAKAEADTAEAGKAGSALKPAMGS